MKKTNSICTWKGKGELPNNSPKLRKKLQIDYTTKDDLEVKVAMMNLVYYYRFMEE